MSDIKIELKKAWFNKKSPIFLSSNWRVIKNYLKVKGMFMDKKDILRFIEKQNSSQIQYKNEGSRKISETGKSFLLRSKFFSIMQADLMFMSKHRNYEGRTPYVLTIYDTLSKYVFLEPLRKKNMQSMKKAFLRVIEKIKSIDSSYNMNLVISDFGSEFLGIKSFLDSLGIKQNLVQIRAFRKSRGASGVESTQRRIRQNLESILLEKKEKITFTELLKEVENLSNSQKLSSINMSAEEALTHTPLYMTMVNKSRTIQKRKYLRRELNNQHLNTLSLLTIVRVKKFTAKDFKSENKESYGSFSPLFVIMAVDKSREIYTYKLGNIFNFKPIIGLFSRHELKISSLTWLQACKKEERNVEKIIKIDKNGIVFYKTFYSDSVFCANKSLIKK